MKVLLFAQYYKESNIPYVRLIIDRLKELNISYAFYGPCLDAIKVKHSDFEVEPFFDGKQEVKARDFDMILSLGGDGTILSAITIVRNSEIPICGINLGRLGFMATIEIERINEALFKLKNGEYRVEPRSMLRLFTEQNLFAEENFALNDFTLHKRDNSSMMIIHTYIDGVFTNSYWADGLIVSTPTGSTGYSLSCGGPIVFPESSNFIITPVAPHNLNVRPLIISDESELFFKIEGRQDNYLCTLDSRSEKITADVTLTVTKNEFKAKVVSLNDISFIDTIGKKLNRGIDTRN